MELMIDIETLDTAPTAKIVEIGWAVVPETLPPPNGALPACGTISISPVGQDLLGLTESKETLDWWQEDERRRQALRNLMENGDTLHDGLVKLRQLLEAQNPTKIWCNGASFDFAVLKNAYSVLQLPVPWEFRTERDLRTRAEDVDPGYRRQARDTIFRSYNLIPHFAGDDAFAQALLLAHIRDIESEED